MTDRTSGVISDHGDSIPLRGKKQFEPGSDAAVLRAEVNEHVARLSEALSRIRLYIRRVEALLTQPDSENPELRRCLADTRNEMNSIYDTMVKVRWAALGVRPVPDLDVAPDPGTHRAEGDVVTETKATVYVVDDNPSVRKALSRLFRSLGHDVEAFASAKQFLMAEPDGYPACVVLDVRMPRMSGLDLQHELADMDSDLPIVFITGHGDIDMAVQAMKDGAVDFLPKPFDDQDLIDSVARALQHHRETHESSLQRQEVEKRMARLTPREREVLEHVVKGKLNKQIAFDLGTAEKTIKVHRGRVMEKMEAESLADLVRMAGRVGIEGPDDPSQL
jgi:FixJ family two-component response regulator